MNSKLTDRCRTPKELNSALQVLSRLGLQDEGGTGGLGGLTAERSGGRQGVGQVRGGEAGRIDELQEMASR